MNDEGDAKQGINREGPLRSITSPPFAGPVAHVNSGPLAHNHKDASNACISTIGGAAGAAPATLPPTITPTPPTPTPTPTPPPPTTTTTTMIAAHPLDYASQAEQQRQQQQRQHQISPLPQHSQQQQPFSAGGVGSSPPLQAGATPGPGPGPGPPVGRSSGGGSGSGSSSSSSSDPLSHLLMRPGGMQMERDTPPVILPPTTAHQQLGGATELRFDFSSNAPPTAVEAQQAVLSPPPLTAEPISARAGEQGSGGDSAPPGFDRVGGEAGFGGEREPPSAKAPPMPALPPPPTSYDAAKHYQLQQHQQHQQRALAPPVPAALTGVALPHPPRPPQQQHQQQVPPPPPQEKSLDTLVAEFLSSEAPPPPEPVNETLALGDPDGWVGALGQLARRRAWRKLVEIAGTMLVAHRGGGAPGLTAEQATDLRLRRAMGMLKVGRAADAAEAAEEAGREAGQPPLAAVSIAARVAAAGAKSLCERAAEGEALDELTALKFELEGVIAACDGDAARAAAAATPTPTPTSAAVTLTVAEAITWRRRVMSCLVNTFVGRGNWRQALELLEDLGKEQCSSSSRTSSTAAGGALRVELLSRVGRVFLQFGSLGDAEVYFRRAEKAAEAMGGTKEGNPRVLINRGLLDFSKNEFVAAQENFRNAASAAVAKEEPPDDTNDGWLWATLDQGTGLVDSALNNLSLAMVYSCDVMRGVKTLEALIRKDPLLYMLDVVIFNLCTLYDLSFDAIASAKKKRTLQAVAQRYRLEDIDPASFRMS